MIILKILIALFAAFVLFTAWRFIRRHYRLIRCRELQRVKENEERLQEECEKMSSSNGFLLITVVVLIIVVILFVVATVRKWMKG